VDETTVVIAPCQIAVRGPRIIDSKTIAAFYTVDFVGKLHRKEFGRLRRQRSHNFPLVQEISSISFDLQPLAILGGIFGGDGFGNDCWGCFIQLADQFGFRVAKYNGPLDGPGFCVVKDIIGGLDQVGGEGLELSTWLEHCEMSEEHWGY
jgi:hypothetical protein